ncbi:hypothetical protein F8566_19525 [Actinomadura rudentiformis]|uniref:Substrate-binding domain-containing protein n=2 Tax=Actinomadura rudentiformis TaxID=359158 RepID=A0A6H9YL41_9ACTN|nr:hypothetical protein F8566_19525 [Actinomadura rudentiformis]
MAMGVLSALKARNLAGKVKLVGNDGISDTLAAVAAGEMYSTNAESPFALGQRQGVRRLPQQHRRRAPVLEVDAPEVGTALTRTCESDRNGLDTPQHRPFRPLDSHPIRPTEERPLR